MEYSHIAEYIKLQKSFLNNIKKKVSVYKSVCMAVLVHSGEEQKNKTRRSKYVRKVLGVKRIDKKRSSELSGKLRMEVTKGVVVDNKP